MKIVVTDSDLEQVEALVEGMLSEFHPDIDFSRGTPENDLLVQGLKVPLALLQSIATRFRKTRSLQGIEELIVALDAADPTEPDVIAAKDEIRSAVTELLANWYFPIAQGSPSRGLVVLHLSSNVGFVLPADWRAYRTQGFGFVNVETTDIYVDASALTPVVATDGTVLEYTYRVLLQAEDTGTRGDVAAGTWEAFDQISPYLFKVTSDTAFQSGRDEETPGAAIARFREGGINERTLNNQRAINARLSDEFAEFTPVQTVRAGDPEMQRDLLLLGGSFRIHQLNMMNVYISGNIEESKIYQAVLNSAWTHPETNAVVEGQPDLAILPFEPILFIREIRYLNNGAIASLSAYEDPDGYVRFDILSRYSLDVNGNRVETPYTAPNQVKLLPYDDAVSPYTWGSSFQTMFLEVNPSTFNNPQPTLEMLYDTINGFSTAHQLFRNTQERPGTGDPLVFSYYPLVLSFTLEYVRRTDITQGLDVDVAEAKRILTSFVRSQKRGEPLFAGAVLAEFMRNFGDIVAGVRPITFNYFCYLPDGSRLDFETTDRVEANLSYLKSTSYVPKDANNNALSLAQFQYSKRTMMPYTDEVYIQVVESAV